MLITALAILLTLNTLHNHLLRSHPSTTLILHNEFCFISKETAVEVG